MLALTIDPVHSFASAYINQIKKAEKVEDVESIAATISAGNLFVLPYLNVDPAYDTIREDRSFRAILEKVNL